VHHLGDPGHADSADANEVNGSEPGRKFHESRP
jgi:hypothetical protein